MGPLLDVYGVSGDGVLISCTILIALSAWLGFRRDSWRSVAESRAAEIRELKDDVAEERSGKDSLREALDTAQETITQLREKNAELSARPDTQRMLEVFESHHADNQKAMQALLANQSAGLDELRKMGEGLTVLLTRAEKFRATDRSES